MPWAWLWGLRWPGRASSLLHAPFFSSFLFILQAATYHTLGAVGSPFPAPILHGSVGTHTGPHMDGKQGGLTGVQATCLRPPTAGSADSGTESTGTKPRQEDTFWATQTQGHTQTGAGAELRSCRSARPQDTRAAPGPPASPPYPGPTARLEENPGGAP